MTHSILTRSRSAHALLRGTWCLFRRSLREGLMVAPLTLLVVVGAVVVLGSVGEARAQAVSFDYTGNIVTYTIPVSGVYDMTAMGAAGAGAYIRSSYMGEPVETLGKTISASGFFTAGTLLNIAVGEKGHAGAMQYDVALNYALNAGNGGGGGTFVYTGNAVRDAAPIIIAGGGGGERVTHGVGNSGGYGGPGTIMSDLADPSQALRGLLPSLVVSPGGSVIVGGTLPSTSPPPVPTPGKGGTLLFGLGFNNLLNFGEGGNPGSGGGGGMGGGSRMLTSTSSSGSVQLNVGAGVSGGGGGGGGSGWNGFIASGGAGGIQSKPLTIISQIPRITISTALNNYGYGGGGGGNGGDGQDSPLTGSVIESVYVFKLPINPGNGGFGGGGAGGNSSRGAGPFEGKHGGSGGGGGYNGGGGAGAGANPGGGGSSYADGGLWNINSYGDQGTNANNGSFRLLYGINQTANDLMVVGGQTTNFTSGTNSFTTIFVGGAQYELRC